MVRITVFFAAALALAVGMTSSASAQLGKGFQIPPAVRNVFLLRTEQIQKELKLTDDQNTQIDDLAIQLQSDALELFSSLQDLSEEERKAELPNLMKKFSDKGKELQAKVDKFLDAKQNARMKELSLQQRDAEALGDEDVIAALKLTEDQKKKLSAIRDEAARQLEEALKPLLGGGGGGGDLGDIRTKMEAMRKELSEKALAVLTTEQRAQFEKMKGEKFDFPAGGGFGF
jgi:Spy/CpxP family protein refolding chaperone